MRKEIFVSSKEELEELIAKYDLEDRKMSGSYPGKHLLSDDIK